MKIFISSLIRGMESERAAVKDAIITLGHEPIMAEGFAAQDSSPQIACLNGLRQSDLFLLILGDRYGAAQASGLSATHEEFEEARNSKPVLGFRHEPSNPEPAQQRFIEAVGGWMGQHWNEFNTSEQLGRQVTRAIHEWQLANASGPLDVSALDARALTLLPETRTGTVSTNALLALTIATGPNQPLLRARQIEDSALADELLKLALFGPTAIFSKAGGMKSGIEGSDLVLRQEGRHGAEGLVRLSPNGDLLIQLPVDRPGDRGMMMVVLEEEIRDRLANALAFGAAVLKHIDPTEKVTHIALAARLSGSAWGWRTRQEHAASPNSSTMSFSYGEDQHQQPVQLTPANMRRAKLVREANEIVEDLVTLLRRRWKPQNH